MRIYLMRHCETISNCQRRYLGHSDSPLSDIGKNQAKEIAEKLSGSKIEAIFSSDLERALLSATPLAKNLNLEIFKEPRLREINFGLIENLTYEQAMNLYPKEMNSWYSDFLNQSPPSGEHFKDLECRVFDFIDYLSKEKFKTVAIFTHGGVCRLLISRLTKKDFFSVDQKPSKIIELNVNRDSGTFRLSLAREL